MQKKKKKKMAPKKRACKSTHLTNLGLLLSSPVDRETLIRPTSA